MSRSYVGVRRSQHRPQPHPGILAGSDTSTLASDSAWTYDACTNTIAYTGADISTDSSTNAGSHHDCEAEAAAARL